MASQQGPPPDQWPHEFIQDGAPPQGFIKTEPPPEPYYNWPPNVIHEPAQEFQQKLSPEQFTQL